MASERTAVTRIDPNNQKTVASTPAPAPGAAVPKPTIPDVELDNEIGRGGMGVVYRGRQPYLDRRVAVKLLLVDPATADDEYVKRFQREAKILAGLSHPHIVACYSAGITSDRHPYLVMEFIDGPNLKHWIAEHGPLKPEQALRITRELAQALGHANQNGIIHRDVKPENVLLMKREGGDSADPGDFPFQAKLVDLGLARPQGSGGDMHLTGAGQVMGTPSTMAPEQFDNPEGVDFRADIYGLGCVLYHALIGRPAFEGRTLAAIVTAKVSGVAPNPTAVVSGLSPAIGQFVADLLAKDRAARPQSYQAVIERCNALMGGPTVSAGGTKLPWLIIGGVGVVAAGLLIALWRPVSAPVAVDTPAKTAPTAAAAAPSPAVTVEFGEPEWLWGRDVNGRFKEWTPAEGAQWSASEATDHGLSVFRGRLNRALPSSEWIITATIQHSDGEGGKSDVAYVGLTLADGSLVYAKITNLTAAQSILVESLASTAKAVPMTEVTASESSGPLTLEVRYQGEFLELRRNGKPFDKRVALSANPVGLYLEAKGAAAVEFPDLTIRLPRPTPAK